MTTFKMFTFVFVPILLLTVRLTHARDLRNSNAGLLLSALCIEDGALRKACLEDISSVSIQKFIDKIITQMNEQDERFNGFDEDLDDKEVLSRTEEVPEKRRGGRSRDVSGFYSNW